MSYLRIKLSAFAASKKQLTSLAKRQTYRPIPDNKVNTRKLITVLTTRRHYARAEIKPRIIRPERKEDQSQR